MVVKSLGGRWGTKETGRCKVPGTIKRRYLRNLFVQVVVAVSVLACTSPSIVSSCIGVDWCATCVRWFLVVL